MKSFSKFLIEGPEDLTPARPKQFTANPFSNGDPERTSRRVRKRPTATTSDPDIGPRQTRVRPSALRPEYFEGGELKPDAWKKFAQKRAGAEYGRGQSVTPGTVRGDKILGDLKDVGDLIKRSDAGNLSGADKARIDAINQRIIDKHGAANQYKPPKTPTSVKTTTSSPLGDFIRKTQETGKSVSQELTDVSGIRSSGMKPDMVGGAPPTTSQVNKARAAADAIKAQQTTKTAPRGSGAQTLKGLVGEPPKPSTGYADLQKAIDKLGPSKPAPKPTKASVAPKTPAPAKPVAPPAAKPTGAARVTYGAGGAPKSSFKAFSQQATTQATTPGSTGSTAQAVQKVDTAARLRTPMGRMSRLGAGTMGALRKFGGPTTAAIEGGVEMMDPEKNPSLVRTGIKKGTQLATASKTAALGAKLGSVLGPKGALVGGLAGGIAGYTGAGGAFEKVAGQTPTEKALAAKANRQVQQIQKPQYGDTPEGSFDKRPLQTVIKDPKTGKETVGYLAKRTYKGQEYTGYKAGDTSNAARAASSSNWLERIGRTINPGAYEKSDAEAMKKRVAKIKKLQGLPEGRTPMKTYTQFVEQVRNTYQQSDTSKKTQSGTETFLRVSDYLADLAARGIGKATDFAGSALSGVVKGFTGGRVDPERIGYEGEKFINRLGRGVRDREKAAADTLSKTKLELNPPGSMYPTNLRRGR